MSASTVCPVCGDPRKFAEAARDRRLVMCQPCTVRVYLSDDDDEGGR